MSKAVLAFLILVSLSASDPRRAIEVVGPLIEDEAATVHAGFWK